MNNDHNLILGNNPAWVYVVRVANLRSRPAKADMGSIFNTFLLMILGLSLTPAVQAAVDDAKVNLTGMLLTVIDLVPLIWIFLIIGIGAAAVYTQFKGM